LKERVKSELALSLDSLARALVLLKKKLRELFSALDQDIHVCGENKILFSGNKSAFFALVANKVDKRT